MKTNVTEKKTRSPIHIKVSSSGNKVNFPSSRGIKKLNIVVNKKVYLQARQHFYCHPSLWLQFAIP